MPPVAFMEHIMPYYDSFDICSAYYHYACDHASSYKAASIMDKLTRLRYRPSMSEQRLSGISTNAKQIYMNLVRKHYAR
jgi:hypothetical protein